MRTVLPVEGPVGLFLGTVSTRDAAQRCAQQGWPQGASTTQGTFSESLLAH